MPGEGRGRKVAQERAAAEESCFLSAEGFGRTLTSGERRPERGGKNSEGNNNKRQRKRDRSASVERVSLEKMSFGPCQGT